MNFHHVKTGLILSLIWLGLVGCENKPPAEIHGEINSSDAPIVVTNRIPVPESVRQNLGVTFAKAEQRRVQDTIRLPGRFELIPSARTEYHATAEGRITLEAAQYDRVDTGTLLYRLYAPEMRRLRQQLAEARLGERMLDEQEQVGNSAVSAARESLKVWDERSQQLQRLIGTGAQASQLAEAQGQMATARIGLSDALARQKELRLQAISLRDPITGENPKFNIALQQMASLLGVDENWLRETSSTQSSSTATLERWETLDSVEVRARMAGVVSKLDISDGSHVDEGDHLMTVSDPNSLRFRAMGLQADIPRLADGESVSIVPPLSGGDDEYSGALTGKLSIGTEADPDERTIDLIITLDEAEMPRWARDGVAAFVEVPVGGSSDPELAIPLAAVVQDELTKIFFKRNAENPDEVIRVEADLGPDDGRWVTVNSGLRPGEEVVVDGVYELKLSGSGKGTQAGHFHSDGTFHTGEH